MAAKKTSGFTLVELVIVIAIIAILAAIGYPAYTTQIQQSRRADCAAGLMELANAMERNFTRNNQYQNIVTGGAFPATCPIGGGVATYNLTVNPLTATTYTLNATPINAQAADPCGTLTLTHQLVKGQAAGQTVADCWQ